MIFDKTLVPSLAAATLTLVGLGVVCRRFAGALNAMLTVSEDLNPAPNPSAPQGGVSRSTSRDFTGGETRIDTVAAMRIA